MIIHAFVFKEDIDAIGNNLNDTLVIKEVIEKEKLLRPQEPIKPYSYYSDDITFENNKAGINLAGTLTLPNKEGVFHVVILISGSCIYCIVSGTRNFGRQNSFRQLKLIGSASGRDKQPLIRNVTLNKGAFEIVKKLKDNEQLKTDLTEYLKKNNVPDNGITSMINQLARPWMKYILQYHPSVTLEKVKCPVLALIGENDLLVPPKENLEAIKDSLTKGGNKKVTV